MATAEMQYLHQPSSTPEDLATARVKVRECVNSIPSSNVAEIRQCVLVELTDSEMHALMLEGIDALIRDRFRKDRSKNPNRPTEKPTIAPLPPMSEKGAAAQHMYEEYESAVEKMYQGRSTFTRRLLTMRISEGAGRGYSFLGKMTGAQVMAAVESNKVQIRALVAATKPLESIAKAVLALGETALIEDLTDEEVEGSWTLQNS